MIDALLVGIGGAFGANCRFLLATWCVRRFGPAFPYGTLLINVSGSLLFGLFTGLAARAVLAAPEWRLLLAVGFLGGYTTFSTFAYETLTLLRERAGARVVANIIANAGGGLAAAALGLALASALV